MNKIRNAIAGLTLMAWALGLQPVPASADDLCEWQSHQSLQLTRSRLYRFGAIYIRRSDSDSNYDGVSLPLRLRTAGLGTEVAAETGPELWFGTLVDDKDYVTALRGKECLIVDPICPTWSAGPIISPFVKDFVVADQSGDWAHHEVEFVGEWKKRGQAGAGADLADESEHDNEPYIRATVTRLLPAVLIESNVRKLDMLPFAPRQPGECPFYALRKGQTMETGDFNEGLQLDLTGDGNSWLLIWWPQPATKTIDFGWGRSKDVVEGRAPLLLVCGEPGAWAVGGEWIRFEFDEAPARLVMMPPFGIEGPTWGDIAKWRKELPEEVVKACDFWAARMVEFPKTCRETYAYEKASDTVTVTETIERVKLREGGVRAATVPPILALAASRGFPAAFSSPPLDCGYRTAYGPLQTIEHMDTYTWKVGGLSRYVFDEQVLGPSTPASKPLESELAMEVEKLIASEPLAPWVYETRYLGPLGEVYWRMPADTAYFLAQMFPALDQPLQERVREYLLKFYEKYPFLETPPLDAWKGPRRERFEFAEDHGGDYELSVQLDNDPVGTAKQLYEYYNKRWSYMDGRYSETSADSQVTFDAVRGLSDYHEVTGAALKPETMDKAVALMLESLKGSDWATGFWTLEQTPEVPPKARSVCMDQELPAKIAFRHIGNLAGMLRLCKTVGKSDSPEAALVWGRLARELALCTALANYAAWLKPPHGPTDYTQKNFHPRRGRNQVRAMNQFEVNLKDTSNEWRKAVFIAFLDLPPEAGRFLGDYAAGEYAGFLDALDRGWPMWHLAHMGAMLGGDSSAGFTLPHCTHSLFMARAWIMRDKPEALERLLDISWTERGDLFYMHKLAETIKAYRRAGSGKL